jgi:hypothetical protein
MLKTSAKCCARGRWAYRESVMHHHHHQIRNSTRCWELCWWQDLPFWHRLHPRSGSCLLQRPHGACLQTLSPGVCVVSLSLRAHWRKQDAPRADASRWECPRGEGLCACAPVREGPHPACASLAPCHCLLEVKIPTHRVPLPRPSCPPSDAPSCMLCGRRLA